MSGQPRPLRALLFSPTAPASALLFGNLFIYSPALVYQANHVSFYYNFRQLALPLILLFILFFVVFSVIGARLEKRRAQLLAAVMTALAVAAWVNSSFFVGSRGLLDGRSFQVVGDPWFVGVNAAIFLAVAYAAARAWLKAPRATRIFLVLLNGGLLAYSAAILAVDSKPWRGDPEPEKLVQFSPSKNLLVILLDAFQSDLFGDILRANPGLRSELRGFTYFPNAVGAAPTTYLSLPAIHSSRQYEEGKSVRSLYESGVVNESFIAKLVAKNYRGYVANPIANYCPRGAVCDEEAALVGERAIHSLMIASAQLVDITIFRMAPHVLKKLVYNDGSWVVRALFLQRYIKKSHGKSNSILKMVADGMTLSSRDFPTVKFLHIFSSHPPMTSVMLDRFCNEIMVREWKRHHVLENNTCVMEQVIELLRSLNRNGIYDRTAVVITADHGLGLARDGAHFPLGSASPLLMIKPYHAKGGLHESSRVVGLTDIPATVCSMTGDCRIDSGHSLLAADAPSGRSFRYINYLWKGVYWSYESIPIESQYEITGPPLDPAHWWRLFDQALPSPRRIAFDAKDDPRHYGVGWVPREWFPLPGRRWTSGPVADLYVNLPPGRDALLTLYVSTHLNNRGQRMTIGANGVLLRNAEVPVDTLAKIDVVVPASAVTRQPTRLLFKFQQSNAHPSWDVMPLSVLFDELQVRFASAIPTPPVRVPVTLHPAPVTSR